MGACFYCFNCGRCKGVKPKPIILSNCLNCGYKNERGVDTCAQCGNSLVLKPGETNTVGRKIVQQDERTRIRPA